MKILSLHQENLRNLEEKSLHFSPTFNVFYGKNGQGKTSFLEALYFGATGLSFRTKHIKELLAYGRETLFSHLEYEDQYSRKNIAVVVKEEKKQFYYLGKKISQLDFYGSLNVVFYIPEDVMLLNGQPSVRRLFLDREISQSNPLYLQHLKKFASLLKIRNQYLKEKKYSKMEYEIYEEEFIAVAAKIILERNNYILYLSPSLEEKYHALFDGNKSLRLAYRSSFPLSLEAKEEEIALQFRKELQKKREKEELYGFSLLGPHKDDLLFLLDGQDAKLYASQGEKKSILFSLKLAEIDWIYEQKGENPIVLIDDITSYFDAFRKENVLIYLANKGVQVFISSTEALGKEAKHFYVEKGEIHEHR